MNFPRQPKPVTIRIDGTDQRDIDYWSRLFMKGAQHKGDDIGPTSGVTNKHCEFTIFRRSRQ